MTSKKKFLASQFCEDLQKRILALYNVIWVHTQEESRAVEEALRAVEFLKANPKYGPSVVMNFGTWTLTSGLQVWSNPKVSDYPIDKNHPDYIDVDAQATSDPVDALQWVQDFPKDIVVVFKDMHMVLHTPRACRKLRDFVAEERQQNKKNPSAKTVIITSPVIQIPVELEKSVCVMNFGLPNEEEIGAKLDRIIGSVNHQKNDTKILITEQEREEIIKLAKGLTIHEFEDAVALGLIENKKPDVEIIKAQKKQIVIKSGILELMDPVPMDDVGGLDRLKDWLSERSAGWTKEGKEYGLKVPKGILLLGVQGCGKSLVGKAIAHMWNLPLYKLDIGRLFSSTVGSSEANTRNMIKTVEATSPSILILDEIGRTLSGVQSSAQSDSGTTNRVFANILEFLNDRQSEVFIVATANDISNLPAELLRKGRFSEIFFVGLPEMNEREIIFRIHIKKVGRNSEDFDVTKFASMTENFSGAEIEELISSALIRSFKDKKLKNSHIIDAILNTSTLWSTKHEEISKLIEWVGKDEKRKDGIRAVYASSASFNESSNDNNVVTIGKKD